MLIQLKRQQKFGVKNNNIKKKVHALNNNNNHVYCINNNCESVEK